MSLLIAAPNDFPAVMQLIRNAVAHMQTNGIDQWGDFYPTETIVRKDIEDENLYYLEIESRMGGIVTVNECQDVQWYAVPWLTSDAGRPLTVHRLAVDPAFQGQGYGQSIMEWIEGYARSHNYDSIRLDAYQGNAAALALYEHREYIKTGEALFPNRCLPFNCYEKVLNEKVLEINSAEVSR